MFFLTGTDEHGEKVLRAAAARGLTPQQWTDEMVTTAWQPMLADLDVSNDDFIRTTQARHVQAVGHFWARLHEAGHVYQGSYQGPYCVSCEEFKLTSDLLDGALCPVHRSPVETLSETNYFFRLSAFTDRLLEHYAANPGFVAPESARNEVLRFVEAGLSDLSITRSTFDWGIPVPWDRSHVLYVWIDALLNYTTAAGWDADLPRFERVWPADVHIVGKDILRFHAVIWPAMLMAAGLALPRQVLANGWLLVGGEKMSKTRLTGVAPRDITSVFGSDALRYYFLREIAFGADGSFSWESMAARYRAELADQFGNLASRLTAMVGRYRGGRLPAPVGEPVLEAAISRAAAAAVAGYDAADFQAALLAALELVREVNGYVTTAAPWELAKDPQRAADLDRVLYATAEGLRVAAVLFAPVLPRAAATLWCWLGAETTIGPLTAQRPQLVSRWGQLPAGAPVTRGEPLFPRLEA